MQRWEVGAQLTIDFFGDQLKKHPLRIKSIEPDDAVEQAAIVTIVTLITPLPTRLTRQRVMPDDPRAARLCAHVSSTRTAARCDITRRATLQDDPTHILLSVQVATTQHSTIVQLKNSPVREFNIKAYGTIDGLGKLACCCAPVPSPPPPPPVPPPSPCPPPQHPSPPPSHGNALNADWGRGIQGATHVKSPPPEPPPEKKTSTSDNTQRAALGVFAFGLLVLLIQKVAAAVRKSREGQLPVLTGKDGRRIALVPQAQRGRVACMRQVCARMRASCGVCFARTPIICEPRARLHIYRHIAYSLGHARVLTRCVHEPILYRPAIVLLSKSYRTHHSHAHTHFS